ncbi:hypothetical protein E4191_06325 [Paracoccus liaowanqingii]|uniref:Uncharacterized protein n=1 Tax=Paracoccus liaowanqingii TaxID=2560053 RepID=A0A4P7HM38_9RHOB|nr:hypothetical protein [Paracoccus liaowanqingii]QBX34367.1 hypothetical protein E4191_06325 [Paracoccus liaowanqingii]
MFAQWKQEKATSGLVDEAQALADRLATTKPHFVESHAAAAQFWAASYLADGQDLHDIAKWPRKDVARFVSAAQVRIAALRKERHYDSSDGLAIWLHTARAVTEPRILPAIREVWQHILKAGPNADSMAEDLIAEADLPPGQGRRIPTGYATED